MTSRAVEKTATHKGDKLLLKLADTAVEIMRLQDQENRRREELREEEAMIRR